MKSINQFKTGFCVDDLALDLPARASLQTMDMRPQTKADLLRDAEESAAIEASMPPMTGNEAAELDAIYADYLATRHEPGMSSEELELELRRIVR